MATLANGLKCYKKFQKTAICVSQSAACHVFWPGFLFIMTQLLDLPLGSFLSHGPKSELFWIHIFFFDQFIFDLIFGLNENPVFSSMFHRAIWSKLDLFLRLERRHSNSTKFPDEFFKFSFIKFYLNFVIMFLILKLQK